MSKEKKNTSLKTSVFSKLEKALNVDTVFADGLPVKYVPYILYFTIMGLVYIGNTHYADRLTRQHDQLKKEVQSLRYDYTTLKEGYMFESKQSEVAKRVATLGLVEGVKPPQKIMLKESEH